MNIGSGSEFTFGNAPVTNISSANQSNSSPVVSFGTFSTTSLPSTVASVPSFSLAPNSGSSNTQASSTVPVSSTAGISFGNNVTTKTNKHVTFNFNASTNSTTSLVTSGILKVTSAPVTTNPSSSGGQSINYLVLQDLTSKWITDFEDLQKLLLNQTSEIINRDIILASNEDKIENLAEYVESLKQEQSQMEQQLDFILSQQKDLEECLTSLEDEVSTYFPELPADDMYKLTENIDSRLKKTLETSKEIITKINDKNRSSENITNPMVAIGRILNHLTNSIQMLENLNIEGQMKLNDLQKMYQQYAA